MLSFFFFDPVYLLFMLPLLALSGWAAMRVKGTFAENNKHPIRSGYSGGDAAQAIL